MVPVRAAVLAAAVVAAFALWCHLAVRCPLRRPQGFCPGPHNITLYDRPHLGYPVYEGRAATVWDGDQRCAAYCAQSPCAVWCR